MFPNTISSWRVTVLGQFAVTKLYKSRIVQMFGFPHITFVPFSFDNCLRLEGNFRIGEFIIRRESPIQRETPMVYEMNEMQSFLAPYNDNSWK